MFRIDCRTDPRTGLLPILSDVYIYTYTPTHLPPQKHPATILISPFSISPPPTNSPEYRHDDQRQDGARKDRRPIVAHAHHRGNEEGLVPNLRREDHGDAGREGLGEG